MFDNGMVVSKRISLVGPQGVAACSSEGYQACEDPCMCLTSMGHGFLQFTLDLR
jgi:hypothetical protein